MKDIEYISLANNAQSYYLYPNFDGEITPNIYVCADTWSMNYIVDDCVYALVSKEVFDSLKSGKIVSVPFVFDQRTLDKHKNPVTGKYDVGNLSKAVQVMPYRDLMKPEFSDGHAEYRTHIACFRIIPGSSIRAPTSVCKANNQFGCGGANQAYIESNHSKKLQENKIMFFDLGSSFDSTMCENNTISAAEYNMIQDFSDERVDDCRCDAVTPGKPHPDVKKCKGGFPFETPVGGIPFDKKGSEILLGKKKKSLRETKAAVVARRKKVPIDSSGGKSVHSPTTPGKIR